MLARVKQDLAARLDAPHAGFIAGAEAVFAVLGLVAYFDFLDSRRDALAQQQPLPGFPTTHRRPGQPPHLTETLACCRKIRFI
jgi:hypothetical protein